MGMPCHHMGQVEGAGTDCLTMLAEVYEACRVIPHLEIPFYPADWNLHRDAEPSASCGTRSKFRAATARRRRRFSLRPLQRPWGDRGRMAAYHPRAGYRWGDLRRRHAAKASQPQTAVFRSIR